MILLVFHPFVRYVHPFIHPAAKWDTLPHSSSVNWCILLHLAAKSDTLPHSSSVNWCILLHLAANWDILPPFPMNKLDILRNSLPTSKWDILQSFPQSMGIFFNIDVTSSHQTQCLTPMELLHANLIYPPLVKLVTAVHGEGSKGPLFNSYNTEE